MKLRVLNLFMLILLSFSMVAQVTYTVSGEVIGEDGVPIEGHQVVYFVELEGFPIPGDAITDDNGAYSFEFDTPDGEGEGTYDVMVFDCEFIPVVVSGTWNNDLDITEFEANFSICTDTIFNEDCGVFVYEDYNNQDPNGSHLLLSEAFGAEPLTYEWSTGETTESIEVSVEGEYCLVITDGDGCTSESCVQVFDIIPYDSCFSYINAEFGSNELVAIAEGEAPFTYEWSTGETTESIEVSEEGEYCLTVIDAAGCTSTSCIYYIDLPDCGVYVFQDWEWNPNGDPNSENGVLLTEVYGEGPFTYLWSTGETTETITVEESGEYCVTVVDATGCEATACGWAQLLEDFCFSYIMPDSVNENVLVVQAFGAEPFTYLWENGETTESIEVSEEGDYCVVVGDANGCVSEACYPFYEQPDCGVFVYQDWDGNPNGEPFFGNGVLVTEVYGEGPFTYLWSTGETTETITVEESGEYCVTVVDATGCEATGCGWVELLEDFCFSYIMPDSIDENVLVVEAYGAEPFTYLWENGETTESIEVSEEGDYCVVVTDAEGCVSEACYPFYEIPDCGVFIYDLGLWGNDSTNNPIAGTYTLYAQAYGTAPFTYVWSTGDTTESIDVTEGGEYCVVVTDADGCVAESCYNFEIYEEGCFSFVYQDFDSSNDVTLVVETYGTAPFMYEWSTGETTETIEVNEEGEYCVVVTDANDCISESCYYYFELPDCGTWILNGWFDQDTTGNSDPNSLTALSFGVEPFTYLWSTGETTEAIIAAEDGDYCVTVTDAEGCVAEACTVVGENPIDTIPMALVGFALGDDGIIIENGSAILYQIQEDGSLVEYATQTFEVEYQFDVTAGDYVLLVEMDEADADNPLYMPTYYNSTLFWEDADIISVNSDGDPFGGFVFAEVNMISVDNFVEDGSGNIAGAVIEGADFRGASASESRNEGDGLANVKVLLLNDAGQEVSYTKTDEDGQFEFAELAMDSYKLHVEMAGVEGDAIDITLTEDQPNSTGNNFTVNGNTIDTESALKVELITTIAMTVAPNPTTNRLTVSFNFSGANTTASFSIYSLEGKLVRTQNVKVSKGENNINMNVSDLEVGLYNLNILLDQKFKAIKFIKN